MDSKLIARIAAAVFAGLAIALSVQQLREDQKAAPISKKAVVASHRDPLAAPLQACSAMGELASGAPDCQAAWAQKRRRFFGRAKDPHDDVMPSSGAAVDR